ncbi:hypothetical protein [Motiliproteus sediminis]|uniref:hypothetical protein n=1 Tax=Motiliproteus sediminis TaxID=1468178 RepID=UPI001AF01CB7|nr:hypothetical protein [Motiliproteus sediminis]
MPCQRTFDMTPLVTAIVTLALGGCAAQVSDAPAPCSPAWNQALEERVGSSDGRGHGPDVGSVEWRGVVEFKLGLRGLPGRPPLASDVWCEDIDRRVMRKDA